MITERWLLAGEWPARCWRSIFEGDFMSVAHRSAETFGELSRAAHAEAITNENPQISQITQISLNQSAKSV
jgi:hypothetical protein